MSDKPEKLSLLQCPLRVSQKTHRFCSRAGPALLKTEKTERLSTVFQSLLLSMHILNPKRTFIVYLSDPGNVSPCLQCCHHHHRQDNPHAC
jgi:hypothetical protein